MLNLQEVDQYLKRIGLDRMKSANLESLNELLFAHLTHVPFENIDIWATGCCPSLSVSHLFKKIVVQRRGGYCFELNTLFCELLRSVGFQARQAIASLIKEDGIDPPAHNVVLCRIEQLTYVLDVGFGGPVPMQAMELKEGISQGFHLYQNGDFWYLEREDGLKPSLRFRAIPVEPLELLPLNFYISQKQDCHFRHILRVNQRKPDGSIYALCDQELRIHRAEGLETFAIRDIAHLQSILQTWFGMNTEGICLRERF